MRPMGTLFYMKYFLTSFVSLKRLLAIVSLFTQGSMRRLLRNPYTVLDLYNPEGYL